MNNANVLQNEEPKEGKALTSFLKDIEERRIEWLFKDYVPQRAITVIAGDGGVGKSTIICNLIASVSTGKIGLFPLEEGKMGVVLLLNGEDDTGGVLKPKLKVLGADLSKIAVLSEFTNCINVKIGTDAFEAIVAELKPLLCVIDPLQAFVPPKLNMASRNSMRDLMMALVKLQQKYNTAFVIVCHTNKRKDAYGRNRISDSSDLWDIARSVIVVGDTGEEGLRYIAQEKSNYGPLQDTMLVSFDDGGKVTLRGTSKNKDQDYVLCRGGGKKRNSGLGEVELAVIEFLRRCGGSCDSTKMHEEMLQQGFKRYKVNEAISDLKQKRVIDQPRLSYEGRQKVVTQLVDMGDTKSTPKPSNTNSF